MRTGLKIKSGIDLAPMVDIVFLLVAYFLISFTIDDTNPINIDLPRSDRPNASQPKLNVVSIDKSNVIRLNKKIVDLKKLPEELARVIKDKKKDRVIIRGDKNITLQQFITVIDYVNQSGVSKLNIDTVQKQ